MKLKLKLQRKKQSLKLPLFNISHLYITFALLTTSLVVSVLFGPGACIPLFAAATFGWKLFDETRSWLETAVNSYANGTPKKKIQKERDLRFLSFYLIYAWGPIVLYCVLIALWHQWAEVSPTARGWLFTYFQHNQRFTYFSGTFLYPVIKTHYVALAPLNILKAEVLAHIYAVAFNGAMLVIVYTLPSVPAMTRFYRFVAIRDFRRNKWFALLVVAVLGFVVFWVAFQLAWLIFDAPSYKESRRYSYNVIHNDGFFKALIVGMTALSLWPYYAAAVLAYLVYLLQPIITRRPSHD